MATKANEASVQMKPSDVAIPQELQREFPEEVAAYQDLLQKERVIDTMINRKMLDLQEYQQKMGTMEMTGALGEDTLRLFIYNTSENQDWQQNSSPGVNGTTPNWTLRIEGKLLNNNSNSNKKMSWFLSGMSIELKSVLGNNDLSGGPSLIEWHDDPKIPDNERLLKQFDGMDINRNGSSIKGENEILADIVIQPKMYPIKLKVSNDALLELLGKSQITQSECIKTILMYAKVNGLFEIQSIDENDSKRKIISIKSDELLMRIIGSQSISIPQLLELVGTKLLKPIDPIRISIPIDTLKSSTLGDCIIDIKVNKALLDGNQKQNIKDVDEISKLITNDILDKESLNQLYKLDENLKLNIQLLNYSKMKFDFYNELSKDPVNFLKLVMEKNDEYLSILTSDSMSFGKNGLIDEELVRRSDFYSDEFLKEHINVLFNSGRL